VLKLKKKSGAKSLTEQHSQFLLHNLQVLYMWAICDSPDINTIISSLQTVTDGLPVLSLYTCTLSLETVHTAFEWNCQMEVVSGIWRGIAAGNCN
jgi:hypothetical protein